MLIIVISSCSWDSLVTRNFLSQNYDVSTKSIDLSAMKLTTIPDFSQYDKGEAFLLATTIDLSSNDISEFDSSLLSYFEDLREVDLSNNKIVAIDEITLNLDILDLSNNKIEKIVFTENAILRDLFLSWNVLTNWELIVIPPKLVKLDLSSNNLENIEWLWNGERLKYLDISDNLLDDSDLIALKWKNTIKYLDIVWNPDMSTSRIESLIIFNQTYIDATTFKARSKETLSGSLID